MASLRSDLDGWNMPLRKHKRLFWSSVARSKGNANFSRMFWWLSRVADAIVKGKCRKRKNEYLMLITPFLRFCLVLDFPHSSSPHETDSSNTRCQAVRLQQTTFFMNRDSWISAPRVITFSSVAYCWCPLFNCKNRNYSRNK